jgi:hypothetical protein
MFVHLQNLFSALYIILKYDYEHAVVSKRVYVSMKLIPSSLKHYINYLPTPSDQALF